MAIGSLVGRDLDPDRRSNLHNSGTRGKRACAERGVTYEDSKAVGVL